MSFIAVAAIGAGVGGAAKIAGGLIVVVNVDVNKRLRKKN